MKFEWQGSGSIIVNRPGHRFANEAQNYSDLALALQSWDSQNNQTLNTPAYVVVDESYLERYGVQNHRAGQPCPEWLINADTLTELAEKIHVPAAQLAKIVERFNAMAIKGVDEDLSSPGFCGGSAYFHF